MRFIILFLLTLPWQVDSIKPKQASPHFFPVDPLPLIAPRRYNYFCDPDMGGNWEPILCLPVPCESHFTTNGQRCTVVL